ncbi:GNAT family N-acetyltransferase [Staphylococcus caprae]|uniref:N-acetyltransferase domain-containing protein n=2 Tax=Staphylococcus TaxID=1279 RepID=A0ABN5WDE8_9STAP|nr:MULTISPECIES: GNAT family N-acetyltransferase [Staphylococcus]EES41045.1 acetyltransferase, GNAT family [Staphylococcus caprae M23864:W1]MBN6824771.1 GNAT family N-acetyltransferase [Staphylococcus caprae]MBU5271792.1 GNAT family N-acetyltransferase [Staphylococcus caprae]MBX5316637.1 GNAT family N-acetyltransferase [Staphylococcus caprae]MBX5319130.1 GNAT family N-acetyltransferase [Staphylococcus caprae]
MYRVRQATENDVVAIRDVATKAWYNTYLNIYAASTVNELLAASYNETHLKKRLTEQLFLVAEEDEEIIGFANFIYGEELYLAAHYVRPESQHKGYGTSLLTEGLNQFKGQYDTVYLEVDNKNNHGIDYYKENGFEIVRSYQPEMYGETMDLALMKKSF